MNIHPIFTHFPIAFFTFYAFFEISRFGFLTRQSWYFYLKAILVIAGSAMSFLAALTGLMAEKFLAGHPALVYHKIFAVLTIVIFLIIALAYALTWYARYKLQSGVVLESLPVAVAQNIINGKIVILLAVSGFITVTITGGLGGIMVYGEGADPLFTKFYQMFFK